MKFLQRLIDSFRRFPSVGPKQAERFSLYILKANESEIDELISAIRDVKSNVKNCTMCNNYTIHEICEICCDTSRINKICVVETPFDVISIEKTAVYRGRYFVLGSNLIPASNNTSFTNNIKHLKRMIKETNSDEVIIALDATTEGQITAIYIKKALSDMGVKISRIAYGIPLGANIDYIDSFTLSHALKQRVPVEEG
ncbi:MAG: recombination mediator RecR [Elusimicrobiales bacterium]